MSLQVAASAEVEAIEISEDELEQVAGGGNKCLADYSCRGVFHYEKEWDECRYTYKLGENCMYADDCNMCFLQY